MYTSTITFTLDTVCPWTYIAKRHLDAALSQIRQDAGLSSKVGFQLRYLPYQLDPTFPVAGVDKQKFYREKFGGSEERMAALRQFLGARGEAAGIKFKHGGTMANTLQAHRVIQRFQGLPATIDDDDGREYDQEKLELADKLINSLYRQYFEEEQHPASRETLLKACQDAGIDEVQAKKVVEDQNDGLAAAQTLIRRQALDGITAVPHVVIEGKRRNVTLVGAQSTEDYVKALATVAKESS